MTEIKARKTTEEILKMFADDFPDGGKINTPSTIYYAAIRSAEQPLLEVIQSKEKEIAELKDKESVIKVLGGTNDEEYNNLIDALAKLREVIKNVNPSEELEMIGFPEAVAIYAKREIESLQSKHSKLLEAIRNGIKHELLSEEDVKRESKSKRGFVPYTNFFIRKEYLDNIIRENR